MFKKLFGEAGVKNAITLFHKPSLPASTRVLNLLKQANANAGVTATEDQASSHHDHSQLQKKEFTLDISEQAPTNEQLRSILEFAGEGKVGSIVEGASDVADAQRRVRMDAGALKRPLTVDWNAGKVVAGDNEGAIQQLIHSQEKS